MIAFLGLELIYGGNRKPCGENTKANVTHHSGTTTLPNQRAALGCHGQFASMSLQRKLRTLIDNKESNVAVPSDDKRSRESCLTAKIYIPQHAPIYTSCLSNLSFASAEHITVDANISADDRQVRRDQGYGLNRYGRGDATLERLQKANSSI